MRNSNCPILLVEDDQVDTMTVQRAFRELKIANPLVHREDGEAALDYLDDPQNSRPCLILLDLNMPLMNGIEFLRELRSRPGQRSIPVVVLTTSADELDKAQSFELGVAGYMRKPVEYRQFVELMRAIDVYWTLSEMPPI